MPIKILRCETILIEWKYTHCVLGAEILHLLQPCVVVERRGSHHLIWWKNHAKTDHYYDFFILYFLAKKALEIFLCKISASHHAFYDLALASSGFFDKKKKNFNAETCIFLLLYALKFICFGSICFKKSFFMIWA